MVDANKTSNDIITSAHINAIATAVNTLETANVSADKVVDGTTNKTFTAAEDTKLAGIATGATANSTDAQLRDRTTHTGVTPVGGIGTGTPGAGKYVDGGTGAWTALPIVVNPASIVGLPNNTIIARTT